MRRLCQHNFWNNWTGSALCIRKKGRKGGRKEGRKEGKKEGRKEARKKKDAILSLKCKDSLQSSIIACSDPSEWTLTSASL